MALFDFVTTRVATGGALSSVTDVDTLVAAGVTHILDARAEMDDAILLASRSEITYCWNPTADDGQPKPIDYWRKTADFALPIFDKPHTKIDLHCAAGCNRGPSNAFFVLVCLGWDADEALALVKAKRPEAVNGVQYHANALDAAHQLGYV